MNFVDDHVAEVLKNFGTRERFIGVVAGYDQVGTTVSSASRPV
jgi:hypothetical protein